MGTYLFLNDIIEIFKLFELGVFACGVCSVLSSCGLTVLRCDVILTFGDEVIEMVILPFCEDGLPGFLSVHGEDLMLN